MPKYCPKLAQLFIIFLSCMLIIADNLEAASNNNPVLRGKWRLPPYERIFWDKTKIFLLPITPQ